MNTCDPYVRWMRAHHLFFVLIEGLILAHRDLAEALENNDITRAAAAFNLATNLFWGSTAAFRFGTDYAPEDYENIVRPTMGPPNYSPGFSDLQSVDHSTLLLTMSKMTHLFKNLPDELLPAYQGYLSALHALYDNHSYVCERFVGQSGESLLQKSEDECPHKTKDETISAAESIRKKYKKRTLKYVGVE